MSVKVCTVSRRAKISGKGVWSPLWLATINCSGRPCWLYRTDYLLQTLRLAIPGEGRGEGAGLPAPPPHSNHLLEEGVVASRCGRGDRATPSTFKLRADGGPSGGRGCWVEVAHHVLLGPAASASLLKACG